MITAIKDILGRMGRIRNGSPHDKWISSDVGAVYVMQIYDKVHWEMGGL